MVPSTAVPDESVAVLSESGPIFYESSCAGLCLRYAQGNMLARRRREEEVGEGGGEVATATAGDPHLFRCGRGQNTAAIVGEGRRRGKDLREGRRRGQGVGEGRRA